MSLLARIRGARGRAHSCPSCASPSALARAFLRLQKAGYPVISGGSENFAEFCPRVIQCVTAAGFLPGGPAPGSGLVPSGYTGPQIVFSPADSNGPTLIQQTSTGGQQTATMAQPSNLKTGDVMIFVVNYDSGTPILHALSGAAGSAVSNHSYSNGKYGLYMMGYMSGDSAPIFDAGSGNHIWFAVGFILRKTSAASAQNDKQYLDNATNVQNWSVTLAAGQILPTQANSVYVLHGTVFAAASAAANNRFINPAASLGAAVGLGNPNGVDGWTWYPVWLNVQGLPFFAFISYRNLADDNPQVDIGYLGANGGAGNQPMGIANFY